MENQRMQRGNMAARNNRAMQSSEVFIRLDISMLNSYDMMLVREKYGIEGWGVVVFIMKYLIERRTDCRAPLYAVSEIARICHKRKNSVLQLIMEFPSLFEIEANGKIFFSPYLLQFFGNSSANEKQINHSLDKLTNETLDNQEVSFPKNKNKEQEQITTKEKKRKETSPSPSQGGESVADGKRLREIGASPAPSQGGENDADGKRLREIGEPPPTPPKEGRVSPTGRD
ncbi:Lin1244/Lin1753 domain-containing protein [Segatella oris]|uniref:Lin1244/Lin1753 domain-containing protein n=1 Tax=Segatella oris TaxID=28135 RepID=UPI0036F21157